MSVRKEDAKRSFLESPMRRAYCEVYCLALTFVFHDNNNDGRKLVTVVVVGVWAALEVGSAFGYAELPDQFFFIRVVVGVLIGRMWGIEINNFAGVEFVHTSDSDGENGGESNGDE